MQLEGERMLFRHPSFKLNFIFAKVTIKAVVFIELSLNSFEVKRTSPLFLQ